MKSHGANPRASYSTAITIQKEKEKTAAPPVLKNIENSREQEDICHMTLTASQTLDLNALQEKRLLYLQ